MSRRVNTRRVLATFASREVVTRGQRTKKLTGEGIQLRERFIFLFLSVSTKLSVEKTKLANRAVIIDGYELELLVPAT